MVAGVSVVYEKCIYTSLPATDTPLSALRPERTDGGDDGGGEADDETEGFVLEGNRESTQKLFVAPCLQNALPEG